MMNKRTTFSCGTALDIEHVDALKERLEVALSKSTCIELKAEKVEKADTAGIQLMLSFVNWVRKNEGSVQWKDPTELLVTTVRRLGLTEQLEMNF